MTIQRNYKPVPMAILLILGGTMALPGYAQDDATACTELQNLVEQAGGKIRDQFSDARNVVNQNESAICRGYVDRIADSGGISEQSSTDASSETMDLEQDATIDGKVKVTLPDPKIDVEQDRAEVSVTNVAPEVTVNQSQPTITIRQAQPIIRVQMPQPTITVEQPAPEIRVTMPDPGVDVATAQPKVDVVIPEPRVTVQQGEPRLNVNLSDGGGEPNNTASGSSLERSDDQGIMTVKAAGLTGESSKPNIQFNEADKKANVAINGSEPKVDYQAAKPDISFEQQGDGPKIEVIESGEPKVTITNAKVDGGNGSSADPKANGATADKTQALAASTASPTDAKTQSIKVGTLNGMAVVNGEGEELGSVDRIVKNGADNFVIVEHGGWFLGLNGKELALPVNDTFVKGEQVVLRGLTSDQIESLPEYSYDNEVSLNSADTVKVLKGN